MRPHPQTNSCLFAHRHKSIVLSQTDPSPLAHGNNQSFTPTRKHPLLDNEHSPSAERCNDRRVSEQELEHISFMKVQKTVHTHNQLSGNMNRKKRRRMNRILGENEALKTTNNNTPAKDDPQAQVDNHTDADSIKGPPENPVHHPVVPSRKVLSLSQPYSEPESILSYARRDERKIWLWPQDLPPNSCHNIIKWAYLHEPASTIDFLLQDLGQVEHFQEYAMKAQDVLKTIKNPMDLLLYPGMTEGYAKRFLTAPLRQAVEKVWEHVDPNYLLHICNHDRTGILRDIMAGLEV
ncbi:MAG: hypothetical protein J3Q66DRAFT_320327 [Benniella sp.]|nr:MAG: hypothetical protein J3Q66DRAFT_320327 [Benniella sp.]